MTYSKAIFAEVTNNACNKGYSKVKSKMAHRNKKRRKLILCLTILVLISTESIIVLEKP